VGWCLLSCCMALPPSEPALRKADAGHLGNRLGRRAWAGGRAASLGWRASFLVHLWIANMGSCVLHHTLPSTTPSSYLLLPTTAPACPLGLEGFWARCRSPGISLTPRCCHSHHCHTTPPHSSWDAGPCPCHTYARALRAGQDLDCWTNYACNSAMPIPSRCCAAGTHQLPAACGREGGHATMPAHALCHYMPCSWTELTGAHGREHPTCTHWDCRAFLLRRLTTCGRQPPSVAATPARRHCPHTTGYHPPVPHPWTHSTMTHSHASPTSPPLPFSATSATAHGLPASQALACLNQEK